MDPAAVTVGDKSQKVGQSSRKLAHFFRLVFRYPEFVAKQQIVQGSSVVEYEPTLLARGYTVLGRTVSSGVGGGMGYSVGRNPRSLKGDVKNVRSDGREQL